MHTIRFKYAGRPERWVVPFLVVLVLATDVAIIGVSGGSGVDKEALLGRRLVSCGLSKYLKPMQDFGVMSVDDLLLLESVDLEDLEFKKIDYRKFKRCTEAIRAEEKKASPEKLGADPESMNVLFSEMDTVLRREPEIGEFSVGALLKQATSSNAGDAAKIFGELGFDVETMNVDELLALGRKLMSNPSHVPQEVRRKLGGERTKEKKEKLENLLSEL